MRISIPLFIALIFCSFSLANTHLMNGANLPVLMFFHGGLYKSGSGDDGLFGPDFIIDKQTILVTINYRLSALGFLSLNSTDMSGNMGLKDQLLALQWIHSNIASFGGDSHRITVIGQSVGKLHPNFSLE